MDIFESLENLNVSEECFNDIMDMIEELLNTAFEEYNNMGDRARSLSPDNKELSDKADNHDAKMSKKRKEMLNGTPAEKAEAERFFDSRDEITNRNYPVFRNEKPFGAHAEDDYKLMKKIAKEGIKKGVSGAKRNTKSIKAAKKGDSSALFHLGQKLQGKRKSFSYDKNTEPKLQWRGDD